MSSLPALARILARAYTAREFDKLVLLKFKKACFYLGFE
jgi:hypothetical protein